MRPHSSIAFSVLMCIGLVCSAAPAFGQTATAGGKKAPASPPLAWKSGTATAVITPKESMWMAGYAARKKPSEGVARELFAKALALEGADGKPLVLVTTDLIGIRREARDVVAERCRSEFDLPPERLLLNASHTHCGPADTPEGTVRLPYAEFRKLRQISRFADDITSLFRYGVNQL